MRLSLRKCAAGLAAALALTVAPFLHAHAPAASHAHAQSRPPRPVLVFLGPEHYEADGKRWTRYGFEIANRTDYPNEMFAAAPDLPPCGSNTKAARTWIDLYQQDGKRLNGFCALTNRDDLNRIWFALEGDAIPPSWIYVELTDRKTNAKYKSELAETVQ